MSISGLGIISGMLYSSRIDRQGIFLLRSDFYGKKYRQHPFWNYVNPENPELLRSLPATMCITSGKDYLQKYTLDFVQAMKKNGKDVILENYTKNDRLTHDFVCLMPDAAESADAIDKLTAFFLESTGT